MASAVRPWAFSSDPPTGSSRARGSLQNAQMRVLSLKDKNVVLNPHVSEGLVWLHTNPHFSFLSL